MTLVVAVVRGEGTWRSESDLGLGVAGGGVSLMHGFGAHLISEQDGLVEVQIVSVHSYDLCLTLV